MRRRQVGANFFSRKLVFDLLARRGDLFGDQQQAAPLGLKVGPTHIPGNRCFLPLQWKQTPPENADFGVKNGNIESENTFK